MNALVSPVDHAAGGPKPAATGADAVVAPQERPRAKRSVQMSAPSRKLQAGDLVCGDCGEANLPTRNFCSRCGCSLADAVAVRPPWWRRILPKRKPRQAIAADAVASAAERPVRRQHKRRIFPIVRRTLAVLLLIAGLVYAAVPAVRSWVNPRAIAARDWAVHLVVPKMVPVRATKITAPGPVDKNHPAAHASDTFTNTYWLTPVKGPKMIKLEFQEPVDPKLIIVRGGMKDDLRGSQRPRTLHVVWPTGKTQDLKLADHVDPQKFELDSGGKVAFVEIFIQDTYAAESDKVSLSELEFFTEQK